MANFDLRPISETDRDWVRQIATEQWGADKMIIHGETYYMSQLPGFIAQAEGQPVGLVTYRVSGDACEITSLNSFEEGLGVGAALIRAVQAEARAAGCRRLYLVTTNDNVKALRFYQKRGFVLCALRPGAVDEARKQKPEIPLVGENGIPIHDELELEMVIPQDDARS